MKRSMLIGPLAATLCAALTTPLLAAQLAAPATKVAALAPVDAESPKPEVAQACLADLKAFDANMQKDGYWLGGSGYGYPMGGYGYGYGYPAGGVIEPGAPIYQNARSGYEVRTLVAAANILARQGANQPCEDVLAATRVVYKSYVASMQNGGAQAADIPSWQVTQLASAKSVTGADTSFRSDQLLGTDVRNPQNVTLGSVDDLVMSPQTGQIAYLVIARGGVFGIGQKFVPVPWADFKATPNASLMVLDTTKSAMDSAPQVDSGKFAAPANFSQESAKVDDFWLAHQATKAVTPSNG